MKQTHTFEPVFDNNSKILILGSFPSVKSRENAFYYGHEKNRFWKVLSAVLQWKEPESIDEKKAMLLSSGIALWDVIKCCDIVGSSDSSIRNVTPNDLGVIFLKCNIERIFANGKTAQKLYNRYIRPETGLDISPLPSTSPANASCSLETLIEQWKNILT